MGLRVTLVSGIRRAGKSAVIHAMIDRIWKREPHYLRLVHIDSNKSRPKTGSTPPPKCGVATARWLTYDEDRIYDVLPDALSAIHKADRYGSVVVEADSDPALRWAYPYDHRVFVMPQPATVKEVFRDPKRAAVELQRVLDDTQAFASEMFGLLDDSHSEDVDPHEDRSSLSSSQMRNFLYSPLGDELATRIQLSPPYHGLVESDVVVVNNKIGERSRGADECIFRVERLLDRLRVISGRRSELFRCDPLSDTCKTAKKLINALEPMCKGGV